MNFFRTPTVTIIIISVIVYSEELFEVVSSQEGLEQHPNYQNITPICPVEEFCRDRKEEKLLSRFYGCQCDEMCSVYEDCCRDSPFFIPTEVPKTNFSCITIPVAFAVRKSLRMLAGCPQDATPEEHQLCGTQNESMYLLSMVPLTVTEDNRTLIYRNVYCARCNGVKDNFELWNTTLVCDGAGTPGKKTFPPDAEAAWNPEKKRWTYVENKTYLCDMKLLQPEHLDSIFPHLDCPTIPYVDQCSEGADLVLSSLCTGYTALVRLKGRMYKNQHCLACNEGSSHNDILCGLPPEIITRSGTSHVTGDFYKYSVLLTYRYVWNECGPGEYHDGILRKCVYLFPPRVTHDFTSALPIDTCVRAKLPAGLYKLSFDNSTITVPRYERNFTQGQFRLMENGTLEICEKDVPPLPLKVLSLKGTIAIMRLVGFGLSIFFLLLHLCAVILVAEVRNLSGVTLASLCLALLGGYSTFIAGITLKDRLPHFWCYTCAITSYYFFIASFLWMLIIAFDVSKVLRASVRKFRAAHGLQWRRFTIYSIIAWGIPIISSVVVHEVEHAGGPVDNWFRPMFGLYACWFGNPQSHMVFFVIPLGVIMLLNFSFFVYAAWVTSDNPTGQRKNMRVYVKLTILLGLNWIVGLLARVFDSDILWVIFSILNTLQGLFIFLSFTLTSKVSKGLSKVIPCLDKPKNDMPLHSASVGEASTVKRASQKSTAV